MDNSPLWSGQQTTGRWKRWLTVLVCGAIFTAMFRFEFFGDYCAALYGHWVGLMSGAVSVGVTFWEKIHNSIGKYVLYGIAAMCIFFSGFQAWQDEHRILITEQNKHNPQLEFTFSFMTVGNELPDPKSAVEIIVAGNITNAGEMPSIVRNWSLDIEFPDGKHHSASMMFSGTAKAIHMVNSSHSQSGPYLDLEKDYLPDITAREAIKPGSGVPGFISFKVTDGTELSAFQKKGVKYTICHEDVIHQKPCESHTMPELSTDMPLLFPGLHPGNKQP
jgi:hypothetical protein